MSLSLSPRSAAFFARPTLSLLTFLAALILLGFGARQAQATIYYVATTGSNFNTGLSWQSPKSDLQATIHAAVSDDQVWVKYGTYTGNFTTTDGVAVYGHFAGTESSISQRQLTNAAYATILTVSRGGAVYSTPGGATGANTLDGFTVENATGGGVDDNSFDTLNVLNCIFQDNSGTALHANGENTIVTNCAFISNDTGIYASNANPTISNCTFTNNTGTGVSSSGNGVVTGCTFINNQGGGVAGVSTITGCKFKSNTGGGGVSGGYVIADCSFGGSARVTLILRKPSI